MGYITSEIFDLLRKGKEVGYAIDTYNKFVPKSLTKSVDESTFMFPCLVTNTLPVDKSVAIVRNMELVYASIVQQFFSQNQMIDITLDKTPLSYMSRFHQNIRVNESAIDFAALETAKKKEEAYRSYMESNFPDLEVPEDMFDTVMEGAYNGEYKLFLSPDATYGIAFKESTVTRKLMNEYQEQIKEHMSDFDLRPVPSAVFEANDDLRSTIAQSYISGISNTSDQRKRDVDVKLWKEMNVPKMLDRDVKKANEIQPYAIQLRLMAVNDKKEFVQYMDFIVGVKAVLHAIDSKELVTNIAYILQNKNFKFNMIRWLTGEISLFKDLLLNIDEIKFDVTNRSSGMSGWIPTLKRLKNKNVALNRYGAHKLVPNNTIVVSSYEVDEIKRLTGLNLRDVKNAKKVIDTAFSIAFIIVDEGTETIDVLYDSRSDYQTYSLETLEKEVSMNSNRLGKEIGRMISR